MASNFIEYRENVSKTLRGGLKDLKKKPKMVKHICHEENHKGKHKVGLVNYYGMYFRMTEELSKLNSTFYCRPNVKSFDFDNAQVGIHH